MVLLDSCKSTEYVVSYLQIVNGKRHVLIILKDHEDHEDKPLLLKSHKTKKRTVLTPI